MKKLIFKISEFGVKDSDDIYNKRSIILTNYISLIFFGLLLLVLLFRIYYFLSLKIYVNYSLYLLNFLILLPIIFNYFHYTKLSRILISYLPALIIWLMFISMEARYKYLEPSLPDGMRLYMIATSVIPYLILNKQKPWLFIVGILPSLLSIVFLEHIMEFLFQEKYKAMITGPDYSLQNFRGIISYLFIASCAFMLHSIIVKTDQINASLIAQLDRQNKLLKEQQEMLNNSNLQLEQMVEERTKKIKLQNKQIMSYAHSNAHYVRGPIARLLGLLELIKIEPESDQDFYIEKIENETKSLDKIVRKLSRELYEIPE